MADSFEQSLRRAMTALGRVVEHLINKAKRAKVQVESRGGMQPMLSVESLLSLERIGELIEAATEKVIAQAFPNLKGGIALEVGEAPARYAPRLLGAQAETVISVEIGGSSTEKQGDVTRGFLVRAEPSRLPFAGSSFIYALGRLATPFQGDFTKAIGEIARTLQPGGQGLIVDYHPFGLYAKRGAQRLRPVESSIRKVEDYYRACRSCGMRVMDLKEAFVDEGIRGFFQEAEIPAYRVLKGTPLLIFFVVYKVKRKERGADA